MKGKIPVNNTFDLNTWKQHLYTEAWKQYCHEDNVAQTRNNLFMAVHTALISLLTFVAKPLFEIGTRQIGDQTVHLGMLALGFLAFVIGSFSFALDFYWSAVIAADRAYLNIRWCTAFVIEREIGLNKYGLASLEHVYRKFSVENPAANFHPFPDSEELASIEIPILPKKRGWDTIQGSVTILKCVHALIIAVGVALIWFGSKWGG